MSENTRMHKVSQQTDSLVRLGDRLTLLSADRRVVRRERASTRSLRNSYRSTAIMLGISIVLLATAGPVAVREALQNQAGLYLIVGGAFWMALHYWVLLKILPLGRIVVDEKTGTVSVRNGLWPRVSRAEFPMTDVHVRCSVDDDSLKLRGLAVFVLEAAGRSPWLRIAAARKAREIEHLHGGLEWVFGTPIELPSRELEGPDGRKLDVPVYPLQHSLLFPRFWSVRWPAPDTAVIAPNRSDRVSAAVGGLFVLGGIVWLISQLWKIAPGVWRMWQAGFPQQAPVLFGFVVLFAAGFYGGGTLGCGWALLRLARQIFWPGYMALNGPGRTIIVRVPGAEAVSESIAFGEVLCLQVLGVDPGGQGQSSGPRGLRYELNLVYGRNGVNRLKLLDSGGAGNVRQLAADLARLLDCPIMAVAPGTGEQAEPDLTQLLAKPPNTLSAARLNEEGEAVLEWNFASVAGALPVGALLWVVGVAAVNREALTAVGPAALAMAGLRFAGLFAVAAAGAWLFAFTMARRRVTLSPDGIAMERTMWGRSKTLSFVDMRGVDGIRVGSEPGMSKVRHAHLLRGEAAPELKCCSFGDGLWLGRLVAAYYGLPLEVVRTSPVATMSPEELADVGAPPPGCTLLRGATPAEATIVLDHPWQGAPGGAITLLAFAAVCALGAALVAGLFADARGYLIGALGAAFALAGLFGLLWHCRGRIILDLKVDAISRTRELLGRRYGRRTVPRSMVNCIAKDTKEGGVQLWGQDAEVLVTAAPKGVPPPVSLWVGKLIAHWAEVPLLVTVGNVSKRKSDHSGMEAG